MLKREPRPGWPPGASCRPLVPTAQASHPGRPPGCQHTPLYLISAQHLLLLQRFDGIIVPCPLILDQKDLRTRERLGPRRAGQGNLYFPHSPPHRSQRPPSSRAESCPAPAITHSSVHYLPEVSPAQYGQAAEVLKPGGFPARERAQEAPWDKAWASTQRQFKLSVPGPGLSPCMRLEGQGLESLGEGPEDSSCPVSKHTAGAQ